MLTLQVVEAVFSAGATFEPSAEQNGIAEPSTQAAFVLRSSVFFTPHLQSPVAVSHTFTRFPKAVCLVAVSYTHLTLPTILRV